MNKKRLLKLADLLEADAEKKDGIKFDLGELIAGDERPEWNCGTTACAIGLAMLSGAFRRQGLSMAFDKFHGWWTPTFNGRAGFGDADAEFFNLTHDEHYFLFMPSSYKGVRTGARGERRVAKRIRDLVSGKIGVPVDF